MSVVEVVGIAVETEFGLTMALGLTSMEGLVTVKSPAELLLLFDASAATVVAAIVVFDLPAVVLLKA